MKWARTFFQEQRMAIRLLFLKPTYRFVFTASSLGLFLFLLLLPVLTTPGNDIFFQFHIWGFFLTAELLLLSLLNGLLLTMQYYAFAHGGYAHASASGSSILGLFTTIFISVFSCAACYSGLLALTSIGFASFFIVYRTPLLLLAFFVVLWALSRNAKRILGHCDSCRLTKSS